MNATADEVQRVHASECASRGHFWNVIEELGVGPVAVICSHCGADSGLVRGAVPVSETR